MRGNEPPRHPIWEQPDDVRIAAAQARIMRTIERK